MRDGRNEKEEYENEGIHILDHDINSICSTNSDK